MTWPTKDGIEIDLNVSATHRVVVFCNGKPQQSFKFRLAEFKSAKLCLFLNDLYRTVQLWESKRSPWCNCKDS